MIMPTTQRAATVPGMPTPAATPPQGIQQVMPGQAGPMAMNQMLQQQQAPANAAGVASFVKPLSAMDPASLQRELANPTSQYPKFAVLAALDEQNKKRKAAEAMQQQLAMQQAQTQGRGTVRDEILAQAAQTGYARGGEVQKFQAGGVSRAGELYPADVPQRRVGFGEALGRVLGLVEDQPPVSYGQDTGRIPTEEEVQKAYQDWMLTKDNPSYAARRFMTPEDTLKRFDELRTARERGLARLGTAPLSAAGAAQARQAAAGMPTPTAEDTGRMADIGGRAAPGPDTGAGPRLKGAPTPAAPRGDMYGDLRNAMLASRGYTDAQIAHMRSSAEPTPEILESRKGLAALRQRQLEESQKETADVRAEAERRLQEAKSRPGIFSDPEALAAIAASISTRKGELMGSAAKGLAGVQGERRKALEAAQEKYGMSQDKLRTMNALNRQMELAMQEKAHAEKVGDWQGVQKANADIAALLAQQAKFEATTGLGIAGLQEQARSHDIQLQIAKIRAEAGGDGEAGSNLPYMREVTSVSKLFEPMIAAELSPTKRQALIAQYAAEVNKVRQRYNMSAIGTPGAAGVATTVVPPNVTVEKISG